MFIKLIIYLIRMHNRAYFQYYFSLLKTKQVLIFTFYTNTDYNSKIIKIILFLFSLSFSLTIIALFSNDSNIHKIYEDLGKFILIYQLSNINILQLLVHLLNNNKIFFFKGK